MTLKYQLRSVMGRAFALCQSHKKKKITHRPIKSTSFVRMSLRSLAVPQTWRVVDDSGSDAMGLRHIIYDKKTVDLWSLILSSRFIPHKVVGKANEQRVFVPALWEERAREELFAYKIENTALPVVPMVHVGHISVQRHLLYALFSLLPIIILHGIRMGWFSLPFDHMPDPDFWLLYGKLDAYRVRELGEWWRPFTALTLHADSQHLLGNILFSTIFLALLSRRIGLGFALFFGLISAVFANCLSVFYRPSSYSSIGFSTALFALVGLCCADMAVRGIPNRKHKIFALVPLCAGVALLALLGTAGAKTDYVAHIFGLISGSCVGLLLAYFLKYFPYNMKFINILLGLAVPLILFYSWNIAFENV